jgi:hypothetical protein
MTSKKEPRILTFEDILAAEDIQSRTLEVPEWGGAVRLRTFTKDVELQMRGQARDQRTGVVDSEKLEMLMLVYGVVEPVLTLDQIPHLRTKNAAVIDKILTEIVGLNRLGEDAIEKALAAFQGATGEETAVPAGA